MNILVTGSLGTLGRPLCKALVMKGHAIHGIDLVHDECSGIDYTRCDIREYRQLESVIKTVQPEYVYHLAAEFGRHNGEDFYEQLWSTNVIGTRNILELQAIHKFKLIFASSSEAYGNIDEMYEEILDVKATVHHNDYAITKFVNEKQIRNFIKYFDCKSLILRFFNAYGPGEYYTPYRSVVCLFCYRLMHGLPITVYKGYHRVFQYIDDFIDTLSNIPFLPTFPVGEIINIGGEEYCSVECLVRIICEQLDITPNNITYLDKELANVTNKQPNIKKAVDILQHKNTVSLADGVRETLIWMKEVYNDS